MSNKLTKVDLIDKISSSMKTSKKDAEMFLNTFLDVVSSELKKGNKITLTGYLSFESVNKAAHDARNPKTGAVVKVPASKKVKVKVGKILAETVNGKKS